MFAAGGRESDRPRAQGGLELVAHPREIVRVRRLVEGPFAHRPGAQRGMADVRRIVNRLREGLDRVEVLGKGLPAPGAKTE